MKELSLSYTTQRRQLYRQALILALITILYNILEGVVSVYLGLEDETIALSGFGVDSFVEVISGIGIFHMIVRLKRTRNASPDRFETTALRISGTAFFLLTLGLLITAGMNVYYGRKPNTTVWGIIIAGVSILTMWLLIRFKIKVGRKLNFKAIIADANCTRTCLYLSLILSSIGYELTGIGGFDSIGAIGIALLSFKEGMEAFQEAKGLSCNCRD